MSELTLDEAIKHCLEVAEENEAKAQKIGVQFLGTTKDREATECRECAADHRQLAEWLMELKDARAALNDCGVEIEMLLGELRDAKRLLKLAIQDIYYAKAGFSCSICDMPKIDTARCEVDNTSPDCKYKWRYEYEALKLIGCKTFKWRYADEAENLIAEDGENK